MQTFTRALITAMVILGNQAFAETTVIYAEDLPEIQMAPEAGVISRQPLSVPNDACLNDPYFQKTKASILAAEKNEFYSRSMKLRDAYKKHNAGCYGLLTVELFEAQGGFYE